MRYTGIDIHKRYCYLSTQDAEGRIVKEKQIKREQERGFEQYFKEIGKSQVVIEACWGWERIYEMLEEIGEIEEIQLAHPLKTRLIAEAQIKTDKLDARALGSLLRGNLIAQAYIPSEETRVRKQMLRQRLYWARIRTKIRNRIHALLDRQKELKLPECSDLFGNRGMGFLKKLKLPEPNNTLLKQQLELLDTINSQIKEQEKEIKQSNERDIKSRRLESLPGFGPILGAVVATEIDEINRFSNSAKLCAYVGLIPTTYASGGKCYQGRMVSSCNKWLRWAFIEAAWVAVGCSGYFGAIYRYHRNRGKQANTSITIVAQRMVKIAWHLLKEGRDYQENHLESFPGRSEHGLVANKEAAAVAG